MNVEQVFIENNIINNSNKSLNNNSNNLLNNNNFINKNSARKKNESKKAEKRTKFVGGNSIDFLSTKRNRNEISSSQNNYNSNGGLIDSGNNGIDKK